MKIDKGLLENTFRNVMQNKHIPVYIYMYVCAYIYIYIYIYTHKQVHYRFN